MKIKLVLVLTILFGYETILAFSCNCDSLPKSEELLDSIEVIIPTFLGNFTRNYYGNYAPDTLGVVWKHFLGKGETVVSRKKGAVEWAGAGWTGQPLLVKENGKLYLIQGAYDHHLKKIDAEKGELVWQYEFDDVVKGTGTIWINNDPDTSVNRLVILQGSRLGVENTLASEHIPSYRAISYFTGKELWRMDQKGTHSYSRDVDGSALIYRDTAYIGLENSYFTVFDPDPRNAQIVDSMVQPNIIRQRLLYTIDDVEDHRYNVVTESSPSLLKNRIYIASGSGHVFGYNLDKHALDWDFYIGSDMDGSAVVTSDSNILVTVEKQYIKGKGGTFKLDPSKEPEDAVIWYFPVDDNDFVTWKGGIIGSAGINDSYIDSSQTHLAAFIGIDEHLYVVDHLTVDTTIVLGPDSLTTYHSPKLVFKSKVGPSISTPIFVGDKLIVAGYWGIYLYKYDRENNFELLDKRDGSFESTPIVWNNKIYVASRDGYLYCLGRQN